MPGVPPGRERQAWTSIALALLAAFTVVEVPVALGGPARPLDYSRFLRLGEQGRVERAAISRDQVTGTYGDRGEEVLFVTTRPPETDDRELVPLLRRKGVSACRSSRRPSTASRWGSSAGRG